MKIIKNEKASVRIWAQNPDHHLFNNHGTWWLHYTAYLKDNTSKRIRRSLKTGNQAVARERRDLALSNLFNQKKGELV